ncbi:MAG TPA: glutathione S-transferase N-terminal domain-containing protein [Acidisphaera sp.]|nr:glutathione S-transferase N-terminal domain-containing protein [Acidisphaera sp.]
MKLVFAPGACSLGIHIILEEIGKPYETQVVNLAEGEQFKPAFTALNPKSKVPVLVRDDGSALTEYPAIAVWLARTNPDKHLLPTDPDAEARALEAMDYSVATIHMHGFSRAFRPGKYAPSESDHEAVRAAGREMMQNGFGLLDKALAGRNYIAGDFSVGDTAIFYVSYWGRDRLKMTLPPNLEAHYARMRARPAVQRVFQAEGLG